MSGKKLDLVSGGKLELFKKDNGKEFISGYACLWEVYSQPMWDEFVWIFSSNMLDGVLNNPDLDCKANLDHFNGDILARKYPSKGVDTLSLEIDDTGLRFYFEPPNTTLGRDTLENVRNGNLSGCSMAVIMDAWQYDGKFKTYSVRRGLTCSDLRDICLTTDPAFSQTSCGIEKYSLLVNTREDYLSMSKPAPAGSLPDEYFKNQFALMDLDRK